MTAARAAQAERPRRADAPAPLASAQRAGHGCEACARAERPGDSFELRLGPGVPLSSRTRTRMGRALEHDFSAVRVHTGHAAAEAAARFGAEALTFGEHIAFAPGRYRPENPLGDALLAHELAHVVQQSGASDPAPQLRQSRPELGAGSSALENEADSAAAGAIAALWFGRERRSPPKKRTGPRGLRLGRCGSSNRNRFPPETYMDSKTIPESESPFGRFDLNYGVATAPTPGGRGAYHMDITMTPNVRTSRAADIGFMQVVRRGDSPTHPFTTSPPLDADTLLRTDTGGAPGTTPTGYKVDQPFYRPPGSLALPFPENTPFYGYNRAPAGNYRVANAVTRAPGHYGPPAVQAYMVDEPTIGDPSSFQVRSCATCMTPQPGFPDEKWHSYGCIDWGFFYDSANSVWQQEEPSFYLENPFAYPDARQLGVRAAVNTWNAHVVPAVPGVEAAEAPYTTRATVRDGVRGGYTELRVEDSSGNLTLGGAHLLPPSSRIGTSTLIVLRSNVERNDYDGTRRFMSEVLYGQTRGWVPSADLEETHR